MAARRPGSRYTDFWSARIALVDAENLETVAAAHRWPRSGTRARRLGRPLTRAERPRPAIHAVPAPWARTATVLGAQRTLHESVSAPRYSRFSDRRRRIPGPIGRAGCPRGGGPRLKSAPSAPAITTGRAAEPVDHRRHRPSRSPDLQNEVHGGRADEARHETCWPGFGRSPPEARSARPAPRVTAPPGPPCSWPRPDRG